MKNDNELFIGGDPRFLAGAAEGRRATDYHSRPVTVSGTVLTTRELGFDTTARLGIARALADRGVKTRKGKMSYHHRPDMNVFLHEGEWPSAGIELETEERKDISTESLDAALVSNWFHFESDSSLSTTGPDGQARYGYELITEPLPPRFYRNPRLWAGLQNILTPWVESWAFAQTGLHVHVGLTQFEEMTKELGFLYTPADRRMFAKYLVAYLYFAVVDRTFTDRVFLRKPGGYCATPHFGVELLKWEKGLTGGQVAERLMTAIVRHGATHGYVAYSRYAENMRRLTNNGTAEATASSARNAMRIDRAGFAPSGYMHELIMVDSGFSGHGVELNAGNPQTIEFRRGKGTLNCTSILRMVECATLLVRFAAKMLREPDTVVGPAEVYRYMVDNTTSGALRTLAEQQLKGE